VAELVLEPDGVVHEPHLHDGYLTGVYGEGTDLVLRIVPPYGEIRELVLHGCSDLSIRNYWEENCVFEVRVVPATAMDRATALRLVHSDGPDDRYDPAEFMKYVIREELVLVALTPSMGADVVALCRSVDYRSLPREKKTWTGGSRGMKGDPDCPT
jgi:hypothetical protein